MSTRDEILAALAEHPEGLTSQELAPLCPAAECDPILVGRMVAALKQEEVIHQEGFREGAALWKAGAPKREAPVERVTLPGFSPPAPRSAHEAALAIAESRKVARTAPPKPQLPPAPAAPATIKLPAPAPARKHHEEKPMKDLQGQIIETLKRDGPTSPGALAKSMKTSKPTLRAALKKLAKAGKIVLTGSTNGRTASLPGQDLPGKGERRQAPQPQARAERQPQRRERVPGPTNGDARFGINEVGELGIEKDGAKVVLEGAEFQRLRQFIEQTKNVWEGAGA
jgi:DNA-binding transcriptional ArsR family regulator